MVSKRKLRDEVIRLTNRVEELEEKICPCNSHAWVTIDYHFESLTGIGLDTIYHYKCKRCGKKVQTGRKL